MSSEGLYARLRGDVGSGEVACPKKGLLAADRCVELQHELRCTCAVAVAAGCAIGPVALPEAPAAPPAAPQAAPAARPVSRGPASRLDEIRAAAERQRAKRAASAPPSPPPAPPPAAPEPPPAPPTALPEAPPTVTEDKDMTVQTDGPAKILKVIEAEPTRIFCLDELHEIHGGTRKAANVAVSKFVKAGRLRRVEQGRYKWKMSRVVAKAAGPTPTSVESDGVGRLRGAFKADPTRWFTHRELHALKGGSANGTRTMVNKMVRSGEIERGEEGFRLMPAGDWRDLPGMKARVEGTTVAPAPPQPTVAPTEDVSATPTETAETDSDSAPGRDAQVDPVPNATPVGPPPVPPPARSRLKITQISIEGTFSPGELRALIEELLPTLA